MQLITPADKANVHPGWSPTFCHQMKQKKQQNKFLNLSEKVRKNKERGREMEVEHVGKDSSYSFWKGSACQALCLAPHVH